MWNRKVVLHALLLCLAAEYANWAKIVQASGAKVE